MSPVELFLAPLFACFAVYGISFLKRRGFHGLGMKLKGMGGFYDPCEDCQDRGRVTLRYGWEPEEGLIRATRSCKVNNTIESHPEVSIAVRNRDSS